MTPESVGYPSNKLVLGKHSGRHAFVARLKEMGFELTNEEIEIAFSKFKELADKKKEVYDEDIAAIVENQISSHKEFFHWNTFIFQAGIPQFQGATVQLTNDKGDVLTDASIGDGPVDASLRQLKE